MVAGLDGGEDSKVCRYALGEVLGKGGGWRMEMLRITLPREVCDILNNRGDSLAVFLN